MLFERFGQLEYCFLLLGPLLVCWPPPASEGLLGHVHDFFHPVIDVVRMRPRTAIIHEVVQYLSGLRRSRITSCRSQRAIAWRLDSVRLATACTHAEHFLRTDASSHRVYFLTVADRAGFEFGFVHIFGLLTARGIAQSFCAFTCFDAGDSIGASICAGAVPIHVRLGDSAAGCNVRCLCRSDGAQLQGSAQNHPAGANRRPALHLSLLTYFSLSVFRAVAHPERSSNNSHTVHCSRCQARIACTSDRCLALGLGEGQMD